MSACFLSLWPLITWTDYKFALQVLLNQEEISGEEIDFILNKYPPQTPLRLLLEEENPGSLPFIKERVHDLEYALQTPSKEEAT